MKKGGSVSLETVTRSRMTKQVLLIASFLWLRTE